MPRQISRIYKIDKIFLKVESNMVCDNSELRNLIIRRAD